MNDNVLENIELEKNLKDMVFGESRIRKIGKRRIWKMLTYKKSEKQFWKILKKILRTRIWKILN